MPDWQMMATLGCILLAGHFLSRRLLKMRNGQDSEGCGSCSEGSGSSAKTKPIVRLDVPDQRR